MKQYEERNERVAAVTEVRCNCCGARICPDQAHPYIDYLSIDKEWGYDSPYDGERHRVDICSSCYQSWIATFAIAPETGSIETAEALEMAE